MHSAKGEQCMDLLCMQNYSPVIIVPVAPLCSFKKSAAQMGIEPYTCKIVCSSLEQNLNHIQFWNQAPCPCVVSSHSFPIGAEKYVLRDIFIVCLLANQPVSQLAS